jgi:hypothetical protein
LGRAQVDWEVGDVVRGTLYLDDLSGFLLFTNEQVAIPYRYRIG